MKTAIVYYTFGGSTKKEAERLAQERGADLFRVKEARKRNLLGSFVPGGFQAMRRKIVRIEPRIALQGYDRIVIGCPVWAGYPAPAFNAIAELLPPGKEVEIFLCSGGGDTGKSEQGTKAMIEARDCKVISYSDITTHAPPGKLKE